MRYLKAEIRFFVGIGTADYEVLQILPFDSVRKRMSVVLRRPDTQQIVVYCKGADSAILPRLAYTRKSDIFLSSKLKFMF